MQSDNREHPSSAAQEKLPTSTLQNPATQPSEQPDLKLNDPLKTEEERLKAYAHLLDSAIRLPGGFRIGLDGIVGLVPGIGDVLGAGLSGYFIYAASRLNIPRRIIARMIINTTAETIIGMVPVIGDIFDFIFKANDRNARLLRAALEAREDTTRTTDSSEAV